MLGALVGLLLSAVLAAPPGADHKCAAGAGIAACTYPPNLALWRAEWIGGGLLVGALVGLCAGLAATRFASLDRFPHRV